MAYATPEDIEQRLGRELDESEATIVGSRLDDVEELIFLRIPDLAQRIADGKIRQRLVVMVECEAVMRLIRNPEGYTQETDGNYSYTIDSSVASGRLMILPEEWAMLGINRSVVLLSPAIKFPAGMLKYNPNYAFESGWRPPCAIVTSSEDCDDDGLDTAVWG
jgi:hypothetical protein